MSGYVVDASVAIKWFIPEIHSEAAVQAMRLRQRLHVPAFLTLEMKKRGPGYFSDRSTPHPRSPHPFL